jgi:hypothetical protein
MMTDEFLELKRLANCGLFQYVEWVSQKWAEEHFGSDTEAAFVVAANPTTISKLIEELERLETENAILLQKIPNQE